jgi:hypothetical protein
MPIPMTKTHKSADPFSVRIAASLDYTLLDIAFEEEHTASGIFNINRIRIPKSGGYFVTIH